MCGDPGIPPDGTKGASVHLRALAGALRRAGHDVVSFTAARARGSEPVAGDWRPLGSAEDLHEAARAGEPDLVLERYSLGWEDGLAAARDLGCPHVLEINAPLVLEADLHRPATVRPAHRAAERRLWTETDLAVAVSEPLRRHVAEVRGTDRGTAVVWNGCHTDLYPEPASLDGPPVVVFLGHPKPWHGADRLPALLAALRRRGHPARLLVVGGGPGADDLLAAAAALGLADAVEVTGPLPGEAVAHRLAEATVALAPYPRDPFFYFCPLKVIECMAAGLPVVSVAQGDLPAIVGPGGILVAPGDDDALADAAAALLADAGARHRLAAAGRQRALRRFGWESVAESLLELIGVGVDAGSVAR